MLVLACLIVGGYSLEILFFMPCYGGHFGTMSTLLAPLCREESGNNCTVVETAKLCEKKLKSFHDTIKFDVIKREL